MDLELSAAVTPQYMILQPEKKNVSTNSSINQRKRYMPVRVVRKLGLLPGKVFATGDKRRPVAIFKELMWRCPPKIVTCSRLYLSIAVLVSLVYYSAPAADGS